jgi:hypothetical protein
VYAKERECLAERVSDFFHPQVQTFGLQKSSESTHSRRYSVVVSLLIIMLGHLEVLTHL